MNLLEVTSLSKHFAQQQVLKDIDLTVEAGTVTAIIGPNGAGKTTMLETILGLHQPDSGEVRFWRGDWRELTSAQLQSVPLVPSLSALENLQMFAAFYGLTLSHKEATTKLATFGLNGAVHKTASQLSGGQQKRLALALALVNAPQLIFLDEPTSDLDPRARREMRALIQNLKSPESAVVFTSHDMEEVARTADRVVLIAVGSVRASGTPEELLARYDQSRLEDVYLQLTEEVTA